MEREAEGEEMAAIPATDSSNKGGHLLKNSHANIGLKVEGGEIATLSPALAGPLPWLLITLSKLVKCDLAALLEALQVTKLQFEWLQ